MLSNRFIINCKVCEEYTNLDEFPPDSYKCTICGTKYDAEDGVFDQVEAEDQYRIYKGAVLAGLIDEELEV